VRGLTVLADPPPKKTPERKLLTGVKESGILLAMHEAAVNEFPFVEQLPKREKSRVALLWEHLREMKALQERKGILVAPFMAAELLGVSKQRVAELIADGRLERVEWRGRVFITETDLLAYAQSERKAGRPCGPKNLADCVKLSLKGAQAARRELAKKS